MQAESKIALDCPYCGESIYQTPSWFKQSYVTCPACDKPIASEKFDAVIHDLEQALNANIDEMLEEKPSQGGCCGSKKKDSCCGSHH